jgi:hypothetical protein
MSIGELNMVQFFSSFDLVIVEVGFGLVMTSCNQLSIRIYFKFSGKGAAESIESLHHDDRFNVDLLTHHQPQLSTSS